MRYLIVSDIHANLEALQAVIAEADQFGYDSLLCLGDVVGYGPNPNEVIAWVSAHADVVVRGNHDKACCGTASFATFNPAAQRSSQWTREQLMGHHAQWLLELPRGPVQVESFALVHGATDDEDRYVFHEHEAALSLRNAVEQVTFFGHTHVQGGFIVEPGQRGFDVSRLHRLPSELVVRWNSHYLLNPGAVGQPRDGDARAAYCIYDSSACVAYFHRVAYDIRTTQDKILAAGLPAELAYRLATGN